MKKSLTSLLHYNRIGWEYEYKNNIIKKNGRFVTKTSIISSNFIEN